MGQIFHPSANTIARASIIGGVMAIAAIAALAFVYIRSPNNTGQNQYIEQPVQFSHRHHVGDVGIDCRYCHTSVEESRFAGVPPVQTCMNCHSQLYNQADYLAPVREAFQTGVPITWVRVNNVADFVYFDHSIHVAKGFGCSTCHGPVNDMPLVYQDASLLMEWCLKCHRAPEDYIRPKDQVFNMNWEPPANQAEMGAMLVKEYDVTSRTDCSTCHR